MSEDADVRTRLSAASERYRGARSAIDPHSIEELEEVADALRQVRRIFDTYEDRATGSGDYGGYVAFRSTIENFVEELPADLPERDAFETMGERVDQRRLSESDFDAGRDALEPARDLVDALEELREAANELRAARTAVTRRLDELEEAIAAEARLLELDERDLAAPVDEIRDPIERYNQAVATDFQGYLRSAPAASVFALLDMGDRYPLVDLGTPPKRLHEFVRRTVPEQTVHELLEYADFSRSKLQHYVDDAGAFKAAVATERTYLERLSADPFQIEWPPRPAAELRWRLGEVRSLIDRFAEEETIASLRAVMDLTRDHEEFDRMREIAVARAELSERDLERLVAGEVESTRDRLQEQRRHLENALEEAPEPDR